MKQSIQNFAVFLLSCGVQSVLPAQTPIADDPAVSATSDGTSFTYRDITPEDLEQVRETWASRDLSAKAVEVVIEEKLDNHTVLVVKHEVMGRIHYGAIALPNMSAESNGPK